MFDWLNRLFGTQTSSSVAKERLRLVLLSDHLALAPDVVEELRRELLEVISRYVEVDEKNSDVSFEHKEQGIAMLANIPILSLRDRQPPSTPPPSNDAPAPPPAAANGHAPASGLMAAAALDEEEPEVIAVADDVPPIPAPRRRRRRRKPSGLPKAAPAQ